MHIIAGCGHKAEIRTDIRQVEGDLMEMTMDWKKRPCSSCEWLAWLRNARKLVPDEADLPKMKGRSKPRAREIRREYLAMVCGLLYDGRLPDLDKLKVYNARILQKTNGEWWVAQWTLCHNIKQAAPSAKAIALVKEMVAGILVAELEANG